MNIEKYLEEKKKKIDKALEKYLPKKGTAPKELVEAMRSSVMLPGKRIRPILGLACAEACGGDIEVVFPSACAIELIHTFTLIHDDLPAIDNSSLRRGRPSCHKTFGEATAILAGDALCPLAFGIVMKHTDFTKVSHKLVMSVMEEISDAIGIHGVVGGEEMDIKFEGKPHTEEEVLDMYLRKTGALIIASVRAGAILSRAKEKTLYSLTKYAEHLGIAFQIADDLLDQSSSEGEIGKPVGEDSKRGKATYSSVAGIKKARQKAKEEIDHAIKAIDWLGKNAEPLRKIATYVVERKK